MGDKYLVVEGYFDKLFYESMFEKMDLRNIRVVVPSSRPGAYNGKHNAIDLYNSLITQMHDGTIDRLCLVVDSDFNSISSQGFPNTITYIQQKIAASGFNIRSTPATYQDGIFFRNEALRTDVALWVMPTNKDEGYLEYLLLDALSETKPNLVSEANGLVTRLKNREFPVHHECKAKLALSMVMLENPGRNIRHLVEKDILQVNKNKKLSKLINFLRGYYR